MLPNTNIQLTGLNQEKAYQKVIKAFIAVLAVTFVLLGFPGLTLTASAGPAGTTVEGWVTRFNVANAESSLNWYMDKLDMELNLSSSELPDYAQVYYKEFPKTQIGLSRSTTVKSGEATASMVVSNIDAARDGLIAQDVKVGEICSAGEGVVLAFFCDPDKNNLALRQDNYPSPPPSPCGAPICNNCK
jgi:hypothetical protein